MNYEQLSQNANFLELKARNLAEGMRSGNFRSLYRGQGIEMESVRDYIRGDDIRALDWNVTARMGKPYVKVFEEHRELQIFLIIDKSFSMMCKSGKRCKYDSASEAVALLSFAAELNDCPLGAIFFDGKINFFLSPKTGREQTMLVLSHLDKNRWDKKNENVGSNLNAAIVGAARCLKKRSLVFVFSDFRTTDYEKPLGTLSHKNDVVVIRSTDKIDEALPQLGSFTFVDAESGVKKNYPSSSKDFIKAWRLENLRRKKYLSDFCAKHGIVFSELRSDDEPLKILSSIFKRTT